MNTFHIYHAAARASFWKTEVYIMFIQTIALQFFAARESLAIQVGFQTWKETDVTLERIVKNLTTARCFDFWFSLVTVKW